MVCVYLHLCDVLTGRKSFRRYHTLREYLLCGVHLCVYGGCFFVFF